MCARLFMSAILIAHSVSYVFPNGRELFQDLSFSLEARLTALVGPNGAGKTCLAKLLASEIEPTSGVVHRHGPVIYFPQRQEPADITVTEFLADEYEWSLHRERLLRDIDRQAICTSLSGGEWMRVRLARVFGRGFLILDEPTNDLDRQGRNAVIAFLHQHKTGALLISHDRECLELCGEIVELSTYSAPLRTSLARYGDGWSAYVDAKEQERERLSLALERAKREREAAIAERHEHIARQERRNRRGAQSSLRGGAPKILLGARERRAQATTGKLNVESLQKAERSIRQAHEALSELKIDPVMYADLIGREIPEQRLVAEAIGFNVYFGDWLYARDLDFAWRGNVRIALRGDNGCGKSTLIKAMLGATFATRGRLRCGDLVTLYIDQRCAALDEDSSVLDNVRAAATASDSDLRADLARFLFTKETVFQRVRELSGGERLRAALARGYLAAQQPELLILDEPTNNLDLANTEFLEQLVRRFCGAVIVVSHDERFVENCGMEQQLEL